MYRGEFQWEAKPLCLPDDKLVREAPLGRNLGRSFVLVRLQQSREKHRPITNVDATLERGKLLALQVRERRHEIEIPVGGSHSIVAYCSAPTRFNRVAVQRATAG